MAHTPSQIRSGIDSVSIEAGLAQVAEAPAKSEKASIIAQTRNTLGRFSAVLGFTATLAWNPAIATESPYEPLADASGKTQLVLKENGKEELFKLFDKEDSALFNSLPSEDQRKVLSYYNDGKDKKTNTKKFYKGAVNLMRYCRDLKIVDAILEQMKKTGKLPDGEIPSLGISAQIATNGFTGWSVYVKLEKANEFDAMIIDKLWKEVADGKKEVAKIQKDIDFLQWFLNNLKNH